MVLGGRPGARLDAVSDAVAEAPVLVCVHRRRTIMRLPHPSHTLVLSRPAGGQLARTFRGAVLGAGLIGVAASAASAQWKSNNLNPAGATYSVAYGVQGGQQVGVSQVGGVYRACL